MKKENSFLKIELKGEDVGIRIQGSGKDVLNLYNLLTKHIKESILENAEKLKGIDDDEKEEYTNSVILDACKNALGMKTDIEEKLDELLKELEEFAKELGDEKDV